jgi:FtsZ-interacting cell division protein ZipA
MRYPVHKRISVGPTGPLGALLGIVLLPIWLAVGFVALILALPVMLVAGLWWKRKVRKAFEQFGLGGKGRHVEHPDADEAGASEEFVDSYVVETVQEESEPDTPRLDPK